MTELSEATLEPEFRRLYRHKFASPEAAWGAFGLDSVDSITKENWKAILTKIGLENVSGKLRTFLRKKMSPTNSISFDQFRTFISDQPARPAEAQSSSSKLSPRNGSRRLKKQKSKRKVEAGNKHKQADDALVGDLIEMGFTEPHIRQAIARQRAAGVESLDQEGVIDYLFSNPYEEPGTAQEESDTALARSLAGGGGGGDDNSADTAASSSTSGGTGDGGGGTGEDQDALLAQSLASGVAVSAMQADAALARSLAGPEFQQAEADEQLALQIAQELDQAAAEGDKAGNRKFSADDRLAAKFHEEEEEAAAVEEAEEAEARRKKRAAAEASMTKMVEQIEAEQKAQRAKEDAERAKAEKARAKEKARYLAKTMRPLLEPYLRGGEHCTDGDGGGASFGWEEVVVALRLVSPLEKLREWAGAPDTILKRLADDDSPAGVKMAMATLRPKLEPALEAQGLLWADALPALESEFTQFWGGEWEEALEDPDGFLDAVDLSHAREAAYAREAERKREARRAAEAAESKKQAKLEKQKSRSKVKPEAVESESDND